MSVVEKSPIPLLSTLPPVMRQAASNSHCGRKPRGLQAKGRVEELIFQ
jgi:hypothetical protein